MTNTNETLKNKLRKALEMPRNEIEKIAEILEDVGYEENMPCYVSELLDKKQMIVGFSFYLLQKIKTISIYLKDYKVEIYQAINIRGNSIKAKML